MARLARLFSAQRTLGTNRRSSTAMIASAERTTTIQNGSVTVDDIEPHPSKEEARLPPTPGQTARLGGSADQRKTMTSAESSANAAISKISSRDERRYPGLAAERFRRNLAGYALAWPWFDGLGAWMLRRLYFPASRLWAAAELADGSAERFWEAVPMRRRLEHSGRLEAVLARCDRAQARAG